MKSTPCAKRWGSDATPALAKAAHMSAQPSMMASQTQSGADGDTNDVAFTFVQALAAELSGGKVELPGFPHIVMRVQRVLGDANSDASRIVRVIGSEPVLATQLVRMANSAALNPGRAPVTDLRAAVARVGLDPGRSATIAFAMEQPREARA